MATVELKMSDRDFWNCTHKKLRALIKTHYDILDKKYNSNDNNEVYGDTISL